MLGKSNTYGRRKTIKNGGVTKSNPKPKIQPFEAKVTDSSGKMDEWLASLGASLCVPNQPVGIDKFIQVHRQNFQSKFKHAINSPTSRIVSTCKTRLSDIRPRLSISPTNEEYEELLRICKSKEPHSFIEWQKAAASENFIKIGESSFSEVFRADLVRSKYAKGERTVALKILPLLSPFSDSAEYKSLGLDEFHNPEPVQPSHLLREVKALMALNELSGRRKYAVPSGFTGFNRLLECAVVCGPYPEILIQAWDSFKKSSSQSENERPDFYTENSLHVILVMEYGGTDLESFKGINKIVQIRSVMLQLLAATSLAEEFIKFEHRDLHLGNVLVRETHRESLSLNNSLTIPTEGLTCSIIDCSLSRFDEESPSSNSIYRDLKLDGWLFTGCAKVSRQYQIYRDMQSMTGDKWDTFNPRTNVIWIAYIVEELLRINKKILLKDDPRSYKIMQEQVVEMASDCFDSKSALRKVL